MEQVIIRRSRAKAAFLLAVSLIFVGVGVWMVLVPHGPPEQRILAWGSILLFSACAVLFSWQIMDTRPQVIIDEHGVFDRRFGVGIIPWSEITGTKVRALRGHEFICLTLHTPEIWLHKLSPLQRALAKGNQALGFSAFNISLNGLAANTAQVHDLITLRMPGQRPAA